MTTASPTLNPVSLSALSTPDAAALPPECVGGFGLHIARDGTWWHEARPITRIALVRLFATVLLRDDQGIYWLRTPVERGRITVEDAPFVGVELRVSQPGAPEQCLDLRTNLDDWVKIGPDHGLRVAIATDGTPSPYVHVRAGLEARLNRAVFYQLVDLAQLRMRADGCEEMVVLSRGAVFTLGGVEA